MSKDKWVWMPHPGHFIGAFECQFRMNTYIPSGYIVSTVGEYKLAGENQESFPIGFDRTYETMVFRAGPHNEPDKDWRCCPFRAKEFTEIDSAGYNTAADAYKGHYEMCEKWDKEPKHAASE